MKVLVMVFGGGFAVGMLGGVLLFSALAVLDLECSVRRNSYRNLFGR